MVTIQIEAPAVEVAHAVQVLHAPAVDSIIEVSVDGWDGQDAVARVSAVLDEAGVKDYLAWYID